MIHTLIRTLRHHRGNLNSIPTLSQFLKHQQASQEPQLSTGLQNHISQKPPSIDRLTPLNHFFIETYGCQMNSSDSDLVRSLMVEHSFAQTDSVSAANVILLNTCAIRQAPEERVLSRINELRSRKDRIIGVLGCMAERLKERLFEKGVHIVCGPDAYRDLPNLVKAAMIAPSHQSINVQLSVEETYADLRPVRRNPNSPSAFVSIMRGCNNMCSFCIVPFVRGRERSRPMESILDEVKVLVTEGVKEVTFLGQNVNSYHDVTEEALTHQAPHVNSSGFKETYRLRGSAGHRFAYLLETAAMKFPSVRFRFTSPHPKDFPDELINVIKTNHNVCKQIHLPAQSGSSSVLARMRRNHTREAYLELVAKMRREIKGLSLSTDLICGFCGETQEQFQEVGFDMAYLFAYSMREKTHAHRNYSDDVKDEVKQARLQKMIQSFGQVQLELNQKQAGQEHVLLLQGPSKRSPHQLAGRTDSSKKGYISLKQLPVRKEGSIDGFRNPKAGDFVRVRVNIVNGRALQCEPIQILHDLSETKSKEQEQKAK